MRASRILNRWDSSIALSYSTRSLISWTIILLSVLHLFTCIWGLAAQLSGSRRTSQLAPAITARMSSDSECTGCPSSAAHNLPHAACASPCLTSCEVETLAELEGVTTSYIVNQQSWLCRATHHGMVSPDNALEAYFHALVRWPYFSNNLVDNVVGFSIYCARTYPLSCE